MIANLRPLAPTAVLTLLIVYFTTSALTGERGLLGDHRREAAMAARTADLARLQAQRVELEQRAKLLSDSRLSADLLEERSRALLGFADPRDYVIRLKP